MINTDQRWVLINDEMHSMIRPAKPAEFKLSYPDFETARAALVRVLIAWRSRKFDEHGDVIRKARSLTQDRAE